MLRSLLRSRSVPTFLRWRGSRACNGATYLGSIGVGEHTSACPIPENDLSRQNSRNVTSSKNSGAAVVGRLDQSLIPPRMMPTMVTPVVPTAPTSSAPKASFVPQSLYKRPLPEPAVAFTSPAGKQLFQEALASGMLETFFPLIEQFHTQSEPAFCGLGTLTMVLNALAIDPKRQWKGPWRWFHEELLDCCTPNEVVKEQGIAFHRMACLAACNGAGIHPVLASQSDLESFRELVRDTCAGRRPRCMAGDPGWHLPSFLVVSYSRKAFNQTGDGHYSPVGGYHEGKDLVLILDVARFKYPPHWVPLPLLWEAMSRIDPATQHSRGFMVCWAQPPLPTSLFTVSCRTACAVQRLPRFGSTAGIESFLRHRVEGVPPGVPEGNAAANVMMQALQASEAKEGALGCSQTAQPMGSDHGISPVDGSVKIVATSESSGAQNLHHDHQGHGTVPGLASQPAGHVSPPNHADSLSTPPLPATSLATGVTGSSNGKPSVAARAPCSKAPKDVSCPSCWGGVPLPELPVEASQGLPRLLPALSTLPRGPGSDATVAGASVMAAEVRAGEDGSLDAWREPTEDEQALMCLMMETIPKGGEDIIDVVAGVEGGLEGAIRVTDARRLAEGQAGGGSTDASCGGGSGGRQPDGNRIASPFALEDHQARVLADLMNTRLYRTVLRVLTRRDMSQGSSVECGLLGRQLHQEGGDDATPVHPREVLEAMDGDSGHSSDGSRGDSSHHASRSGSGNGDAKDKEHGECAGHGHGHGIGNEGASSAPELLEPTLEQRGRAVRMALMLSLIPPEQWKEFLERAPGREARKDAIISSLLAMHLEHRTLGSEVGHLRQQVQGLLAQVPDSCCGGAHGGGSTSGKTSSETATGNPGGQQQQARSCGVQICCH